MNRTWEVPISGGAYFVVVTPDRVSVGREQGRDGGGFTVTHAQFLRGEHQDFVVAAFGAEVLAEVIAAVRDLGERTPPGVASP